jgi:hypothetical protein
MDISVVSSLARFNLHYYRYPWSYILVPLVNRSVEVTEEIMFFGMYVDAHAARSPLRRSLRAGSSQDAWRLLYIFYYLI